LKGIEINDLAYFLGEDGDSYIRLSHLPF